MADLARYASVAMEAALIAGALIKVAWSKPTARLADKGVSDLLTETDIRCEQVIVQHIKSNLSDVEFEWIGEESWDGHALTDAPTWLIDPIDGTSNFIHRFPCVAVSIALAIQKRTQVAVIYLPMLNELYTATEGGGCFLNGQPSRVSSVSTLKESMITTNVGKLRLSNEKRQLFASDILSLIPNCHQVQMVNSACCQLCFVACGRVEAYIERAVGGPWDTAAGDLLVREAGGIMSGYNGPFDCMTCSVMAVCNKGILNELKSLLPKADDL